MLLWFGIGHTVGLLLAQIFTVKGVEGRREDITCRPYMYMPVLHDISTYLVFCNIPLR